MLLCILTLFFQYRCVLAVGKRARAPVAHPSDTVFIATEILVFTRAIPIATVRVIDDLTLLG